MIIRFEGYPVIIDKKEIEKIFSKYGSIEKIVKEECESVARVTMPYDYQAKKAIKELNGSKIFGRAVKASMER